MKQEKKKQKPKGQTDSPEGRRAGEAVRGARWHSRLRKTGLILTAVSGALLSSSLSLPWYVPVLATVAGVAGTILTILTQPSPDTVGRDMIK